MNTFLRNSKKGIVIEWKHTSLIFTKLNFKNETNPTILNVHDNTELQIQSVERNALPKKDNETKITSIYSLHVHVD